MRSAVKVLEQFLRRVDQPVRTRGTEFRPAAVAPRDADRRHAIGSGTFDIGAATIDVDFSTDTLQSIADKINAAGTANATAQVVTVTEGTKTIKKLEITGNGGVPPTVTDTVRRPSR